MALAVERCLQKDPAKRFQHVGLLASALLPFAPKRARICAERAISVLRDAGIAEASLRVHSTMPPPTAEALGVAATLAPPPAASVPRFLEGSPTSTPVEAVPASVPAVIRKRPVGALAAGAVCVAAAAVAFAVWAGRVKPPVPQPSGAPQAAAAAAPLPIPATATPPASDVAPVTMPPPSTATVGMATGVVTPVAPAQLQGSHAALRGHAPPAVAAKPAPDASSVPAPPPPPQKKAPSDQGPDLGY
jgi:hypothetical protein